MITTVTNMGIKSYLLLWKQRWVIYLQCCAILRAAHSLLFRRGKNWGSREIKDSFFPLIMQPLLIGLNGLARAAQLALKRQPVLRKKGYLGSCLNWKGEDVQNVSGNKPLGVVVIKISNFFWTVGGSQRALNNPTQKWREKCSLHTEKPPRDLNPGPFVTTAPSLESWPLLANLTSQGSLSSDFLTLFSAIMIQAS